MKAYLQELFNSLRNNKLRTALTGFSIAWGIVLLVVMLGAGKGVENGIRQMVATTGVGQLEVNVTLSNTRKPYAGYQEGRQLYLNSHQLQYLQDRFDKKVECIVPKVSQFTLAHTEYGSSNVQLQTLTEEEQSFNKLELLSGRLFTSREHLEGMRQVVLSENMVSKLFSKRENPIGKLISINGVNYELIGIVKSPVPFYGIAYFPYKAYASIYPNTVLKIFSLKIFPKKGESGNVAQLNQSLKEELYTLLKVDPTDEGAVSVDSSSDVASTMDIMFVALQVLLWVMGVGSLSVGTIGVSNIMYVTVQERMREIGIRKAIGARPKDIMQLVLGESILLSLCAGVVGLLVGTGIVKLLAHLAVVNHWGEEIMPAGPGAEMKLTLFVNPEVNIGVAIGALIVLVVAGFIAGRGPARKAIKIPAVVAMQDLK